VNLCSSLNMFKYAKTLHSVIPISIESNTNFRNYSYINQKLYHTN